MMATRVLFAAGLALAVVFPAAAADADKAHVTGSLEAHDPSRILRDGNRYYLFYTEKGIGSKDSTDLLRWTEGPPVFATPPAWTTLAVPGFRGKIWAPDLIRVKDKYFLYYSISTFGKQTSALGLATNTTLDPSKANYKWIDEGIVLQSHEGLPYNAIDPAPFLDDDGKLWLVWGSYWEGIHVAELDPATGKRLHPEPPPVQLARQKAPSTDIEAAYLHKHGGKYYLFVNFGSCCSGVKSTYNIRVGRGESPTGPFVDKNGVDLKDGGGTMFLEGDGERYIGPGHIGVLEFNDSELVSFHFYDGEDQGRSKFRIRRLEWQSDEKAGDWPAAGDFWGGWR